MAKIWEHRESIAAKKIDAQLRRFGFASNRRVQQPPTSATAVGGKIVPQVGDDSETKIEEYHTGE